MHGDLRVETVSWINWGAISIVVAMGRKEVENEKWSWGWLEPRKAIKMKDEAGKVSHVLVLL